MTILVGEMFLIFVSINIHRNALPERLAENNIGLEALDQLSNVHPASNKFTWKKKGHQQSSSEDLLRKGRRNGQGSRSSSGSVTPDNNGRKEKRGLGLRRRKNAVASVIIDRVGEAIG